MPKNKITQKRFDNKRAFFDYELLERIECGLELRGDEVKAIRGGKVQLRGSYGKILQGKNGSLELFIVGMYLGSEKIDAQRTRKLLVHKKEIKKLVGTTQQKKLTLVPTRLYFKRGRAKIELAVSRGRKNWDKREVIKKREAKREARY